MKTQFRLFVILILSFVSWGCASRAVQSERVLADSNRRFPPQYKVLGVPFIEQKTAQCGPATLAMALNFQERATTAEELVPMVMTDPKRGTLRPDMISAARRLGYMAVPITGMDLLFSEVSQGHPVIVFENLSVSWLPQWHYALVYGYNLETETVTLHSGPEEAKVWDLKKFERSWMLGDYWGLVILKPGQIAHSAGELANLAAAAGLERAGHLDRAHDSYQGILTAWPQSLGARIGLANVAFAKNNYPAARSHLRTALKHHPDSTAALHNLKVVEQALQKTQASLDDNYEPHQ